MTSNNPSINQNKPNQNFIAIAAVIGVLLLGIIGYLAYQNMQKSRQLETTMTDLDETTKLKAELERMANT